MKLPQILNELALKVHENGGRLYAVGGWVRDAILGRNSMDIDCEVHGLTAEDLEKILRRQGPVAQVGKSFGVFKWTAASTCYDISIAPEHPDFTGEEVSVEGALDWAIQRRDFCCNALMYDPLSNRVIDRVNGEEDITNRLLRVVDSTRFSDDPLRAIRGPRFVATLGFALDPKSEELCGAQDLSKVPAERLWRELSRLLLGQWPHRGWESLQKLGLLSQIFPGADGLNESVCVHYLKEALQWTDLEDPEGALSVQLALVTSTLRDDEFEHVFSRLKLERFRSISLRRVVRDLREWGVCSRSNSELNDAALCDLADRCPVRWGLVAACAMNPELDFNELWQRAIALGLDQGPLPILITGQDVLERGVAPGPAVGRALAAGRKEQVNGVFSDRGAALKWMDDWLLREKKRSG